MITSLVPAASRPWLLNSVAAALAAFTFTGWWWGFVALGAIGMVAAILRHPLLILVIFGVGVGALVQSSTPLPPGDFEGSATATSDSREGRFGRWALARSGNAFLYLDLDRDAISFRSGDVLRIGGRVTDKQSSVGGRPRQIVKVDELAIVGRTSTWLHGPGGRLRELVVGRLSGSGESRGLLAGFLVGEVSEVSEPTQDAMRKAGLSHFVAVSGSNVALFLATVAIVTVPLGVGPRRRAVFGLMALPVFVVATRFEPSVIRASVSAAVVLMGRLFDFALEIWQVIGAAAVVILVIDPWIIRDVGFQLSVAATTGVVLGMRWPTPENFVLKALTVTLGAQLAVAPLLLIHFGSVPLLAPLTNLLAAPVVTAATALGIAGVAGVPLVFTMAEWLASIVISLAHIAAGWPQLSWTWFLAALVLALVAALLARRRPGAVTLAVALALVAVIIPWGGPGLDPGQVAVLDVGQGDAIVVFGDEDHVALVDGGAEGSTLLDGLRRHGVTRLDLVVMTHGDADHAGGLSDLFGRVEVGLIWDMSHPHETSSSRSMFEAATRYGVRIAPAPLDRAIPFGEVSLEVISPRRRFESPNDQSIVIVVVGRARSMLLTGDIERVAQSEIDTPLIDILKVPHHGAATSDEDWLVSTGATEAIVSVGPNTFGHPVEWVIESLQLSGATVRRTDVEGTIVVDLAQP